MSHASLGDELSSRIDSVMLRTGELALLDLSLKDIDILAFRGSEEWQVQLQNEMLDGDVRISDDESTPLEIHLRRLSVDAGEEKGEAGHEEEENGENGKEREDPFRDTNPLDLGNVNVSIGQLLLGDEDYGTWAFRLRTDTGVARFEDLEAKVKGVDIVAGAEVEWRVEAGLHESRFRGDIHVDNLTEVLHDFGLAPSAEGRNLDLGADLTWPGSPVMVDIKQAEGTLAIREGKGRFVQADAGAFKLLGIFDIASLGRRLKLDFSDVLEKGFEFSDISGVVAFEQGLASVQESVVIEGSSSRITLGGNFDMNSGILDNDMIVTLPVDRALPWYAAYSAIAGGPLAGAGVMIAQQVFKNQINQMTSVKYKISGTLEDPDIDFTAIFNNSVRTKEPSARDKEPSAKE